MLEYIYFVKCPGCDDEHFDFFDEAKEFAMGCLTKKPIITQTEVCRNDFGECTDHCDLGTVWSWENMMQDTTTDAEPAKSVFTKDDLKTLHTCNCNGSCGGNCKCGKHKDPEFDDDDFYFDNNLVENATAKMSFKNKEEQSEFFRLCSEIGIITGADLRRFMSENTADGSALLSKLRAYRAELGDDFKIEEAMVEHVNEEHPVIESDQELSGIDNCVVPCKVAKVVAHSEDEKPVTCKKPIPEGMTIEQLVEAMEENEDTVECSMCEELFLKADGVKNGYSYICPTCSTTDDTADAFNQEFPEVEPDTTEEFSETDIGRVVADLVVDEFEAISNYEAATDAIQHSKIPEEKQVEILDTLDHIRKEEEEHIEELKAITTVEDHVLDEELATDETVQCAGCEESFPKDECIHKEDIGYLCSDCEDCIVKCTWCEDLYDRSECRREVDLGWLCSRCEMAIKSRGETLTFREGGYWDFLDESIDDSKTLADLVKDSINHLTSDIGKDPWAEDFADDVIADIENNYDIEVPTNIEKYGNWASAIACEVSRQVNNLDNLTEASLSDIRLCPECGKETFDIETGICVACGFN